MDDQPPLPHATFDPTTFTTSDIAGLVDVFQQHRHYAPHLSDWVLQVLRHETLRRRREQLDEPTPAEIPPLPQDWTNQHVSEALMVTYMMSHGSGSLKCGAFVDCLHMRVIAMAIGRLRGEK